MIPIEDAFEIGSGVFAYRTEINMDHHEEGNDEPGEDVEQVSQMQTTGSQYCSWDSFRVEQRPAADKYNGNEQIHNKDIGKTLQRVEFIIPGNRERRLFSFENPERIVFALGHQPFREVPVFNLVLLSVISKQVPDKEDHVVDGQDDPGNVVNGHSRIEADQGYSGSRELHADPGNDQEQAKEGIHQMPEPDPDRVQV